MKVLKKVGFVLAIVASLLTLNSCKKEKIEKNNETDGKIFYFSVHKFNDLDDKNFDYITNGETIDVINNGYIVYYAVKLKKGQHITFKTYGTFPTEFGCWNVNQYENDSYSPGYTIYNSCEHCMNCELNYKFTY